MTPLLILSGIAALIIALFTYWPSAEHRRRSRARRAKRRAERMIEAYRRDEMERQRNLRGVDYKQFLTSWWF